MAKPKESIHLDWETSGVNFTLECKCGALGAVSGKGILFVECHACGNVYRLSHVVNVYKTANPQGGICAMTEPVTNVYDPSDDLRLI